MNHETFHPFPKLPTELRIKIWHLAQPDREIIPLANASMIGRMMAASNACKGRRHIVVPLKTVPSLFHVCVEVREVCLADYSRGFRPDGVAEEEDVQCSHLPMVTRHVRQGKKGDVPERDVYWRPRVDVMLVQQKDFWEKLDRASCVLFESEAPFGGLQSYGVQHVILPVAFFSWPGWDPRLCGYTWGMETVYIVLERRREDTPEVWEEHLAWFARWWLKVSKTWRETVGEDAPLEEKVPFLPKAVGCFEGEELKSRDLDESRECILVEEGEADAAVWNRDKENFHARRYADTHWW